MVSGPPPAGGSAPRRGSEVFKALFKRSAGSLPGRDPSLRRRRKSQGEFLAEAEVGRIVDEKNGTFAALVSPASLPFPTFALDDEYNFRATKAPATHAGVLLAPQRVTAAAGSPSPLAPGPDCEPDARPPPPVRSSRKRCHDIRPGTPFTQLQPAGPAGPGRKSKRLRPTTFGLSPESKGDHLSDGAAFPTAATLQSWG